MLITDQVLAAIRAAVERAGSPAEFARLSGVPAAMVGRYLSGANREVRAATWGKLAPHLREFLPAREFREDSPDREASPADPLAGLGERERLCLAMLRSLPAEDQEKVHTLVQDLFARRALAAGKAG